MRKTILFLILLVIACPALADAQAHQGADWVRITARPCTNEAVLARIRVPDRLDYRQASAEFQGTAYAPCWCPEGNGIRLIYEDGDEGVIPLRELTPVPEA